LLPAIAQGVWHQDAKPSLALSKRGGFEPGGWGECGHFHGKTHPPETGKKA